MQKRWLYFMALGVLAASAVWLAVLTFPTNKLHLITCDVGQGDAILIQMGSDQILTDGGTGGSKVLNCLSKYMPFWDRSIELVVLTNPDRDHYGGLIDVFERFTVKNILVSGLDDSSQSYQVLESLVRGSNTKVLHATSQQGIRLGSMQLDILHPSENYVFGVANGQNLKDTKVLGIFSSSGKTNNFSVVSLLTYGDFNALLTGDIEDIASDYISDNPAIVDTDIELLKVPHHGSKNGLSKLLFDAVSPQVVVISAGKGNRYGHPHEEVLTILRGSDAKILRTDQLGDIVVESDGKSWRVR